MNNYDQTLPEVVRRDDALPEVAQPAGSLPPGQQYLPGTSNNAKSTTTTSSAVARRSPWISRRMLWISAIVCLVVVTALAIALGLVLSHRGLGNDTAGNGSSTPDSGPLGPSPTATTVNPGTVGVMTGTATASRAYGYPTMVVYPGVVNTWYAIDASRRIKKRWVWNGTTYPSSKTTDWEDHGGPIDDVQRAVCAFVSVPYPQFPAFENLVALENGVVDRQRWNGSSWLAWETMGQGSFATGPAGTTFGDGREGVFLIGQQGELYQFTSDLVQGPNPSGQWSLTRTAGDWAAIEPAVLRWGFNLLYVFLVAKDASVYYLSFTNSTSSPLAKLGGYATSRPVAVSWGNSISLFVRGGDGALWWTKQRVSAGEWSPWDVLVAGVQIAGEPEVVSIGLTSVHIFVFVWAAANQSVLCREFDGTKWMPDAGYTDIGLKLSDPPKASTGGDGQLIVFGYSGRTVLSRTYNESQGGWADSNVDLGDL